MPIQAETFNDVLNEDCLNLLRSEGGTIAERAYRLSDRLETYDLAMKNWSVAKQRRAQLENILFSFMNFKNEREKNNKKIIGQTNLETFVSDNQAIIEQLLYYAPEAIKKDWHERQNQLLQPTFGQKIKTVSLNVTQTLSTPVTIMFRLFASERLKKTVSKYTPKTFRAECQEKLGELIDSGIRALPGEIARIQTKQLSALNPLCRSEEDRGKLNKLLHKTPDDTLALIQTQISQTHRLLDDYQKIRVQIRAEQDMLGLIQAFDRRAQSFIARYDDFWVRLSNFFAQFFSFFKSDTAHKIDAIKSMQAEVSSIKQVYETEISAQLQSIQARPDTLENLKADLVTPLFTKDNPNTIQRQMNHNRASLFNAIKHHRNLIKPFDALQEDLESSPEPGGSPSA